MTKFDQIFNNIVTENIDDMKEPYQGELPSQEHEYDTLSHPVKDEMIQSFKKWIEEGEHQDGEAFWDNFEDVQEAVGDFLRTVGGTPG